MKCSLAAVLFSVLLLGLLFSAFFYSILLAQRAEVPPQTGQEQAEVPVAAKPDEKKVPPKRIREGTELNGEKVFFRQNGTRTVLYFVNNNQRRYACLENLTLERVLKSIETKPEHKFWKVNGKFTEFRGENYILLTRAVVTTEH
ncbi:MAG: hypothetical protein LBU65_14095 [Planctomycetaceae bacterium]|jgi:hypothetical protein|nr:hypothetical protein [Planctomycetaceae bacterium]